MLCLLYSQDLLPAETWSSGDWYLKEFDGDAHSATILDCEDQEGRGQLESPLRELEAAFKADRLPHHLFWMAATATFPTIDFPVSAIGIATNRKNRLKAAKMALAITGFCFLSKKAPDSLGRLLPELQQMSHRPLSQLPPHDSPIYDLVSGGPTRRHTRTDDAQSWPSQPARCSTLAVHGGGSGELTQILQEVTKSLGNKVSCWREVAKPKRRESPEEAPDADSFISEYFQSSLKHWLTIRGVHSRLTRDESKDFVMDKRQWLFYSYHHPAPLIEPRSHWEVAFHGTWWCGLWLLLEHGILLESHDLNAGHEFWEPGVYCSPHKATAATYARPQPVFSDGVYHRVLLKVRFDRSKLLRERARGGGQLVVPSQGITIEGVFFGINTPPRKGEERLDEWDPTIEARPSGRGIIRRPTTGFPPSREARVIWDPRNRRRPTMLNVAATERVVRHALTCSDGKGDT